MTEEKGIPINRSDSFVMHFQIAGLCKSLRLIVQTGQVPGDTTFQLLQKLLYTDAMELTNGRCVVELP